jgi:molybdopterin converting factor small subunit
LRIKVHYISLVKTYTKTSQEEINLSPTAVLSDLLDRIAEKYGESFAKEVYDPKNREMKSTFVAMVNGIHMNQLKGMNTSLKEGDNIILMSLMTGG